LAARDQQPAEWEIWPLPDRELTMNRKLLTLVLALLAGLVLLAGGPALTAHAAFPGANGRIVFARPIEGLQIMDVDGSNVTSLGVNCSDPAWSPDGMRIVCYQWVGGSNTKLYLVDVATGQSQPVTAGLTQDIWPAWAPDGTRIAYSSWDLASDVKIVAMNADGSDPVTLSQQDDRYPAWSPDGKKIAFISLRTGTSELYVMNADGTGQTRLTYNNRADAAPAWSPDGKTIAIAAVLDNHWEIVVMDADGRNEKRLTHLASDEIGSPSWSPDGEYILLEHEQTLYVVNRHGSELTQVAEAPVSDGGGDWQPLRTRLEVSAFIDGRSQMVVRDGSIYWHHFDYAAPGRHADGPGGNVPTTFNGNAWYPIWPGDPPDHDPADPIDNEVRCGDCTTLDKYLTAPPLAAKEQVVALNAVDARGEVTIVQQPSAENDFTLIVEFDDNLPIGPAWYSIVLAYEQSPFVPTNDAFVMQAHPRPQYGNRRDLRVRNAAKDLVSYVKFNVHTLEGTVEHATLRLYVTDPGPDGGMLYAVSPYYKNTTDLWLETGLKWNNAPTISSPPLATLGKVLKNRWVEVDVTQAVIDGLANDNGRVSFALANDSRNRVAYSSKEGAHPPELVVVITR
jgi:dipeptidyl aminopeptidase/acylaminoacyl peptidase